MRIFLFEHRSFLSVKEIRKEVGGKRKNWHLGMRGKVIERNEKKNIFRQEMWFEFSRITKHNGGEWEEREWVFNYTDVQGGLGDGADEVLLSAYSVWFETAALQALWLCHQESIDGTHNLWEANIEVFRFWSLYHPLTKGSETSPPSLEKVRF